MITDRPDARGVRARHAASARKILLLVHERTDVTIIVIWDLRVQDTATGEWLWIGYGAGLSSAQGLGPRCVSMSIEYAGMM